VMQLTELPPVGHGTPASGYAEAGVRTGLV
jgi:hypothetical protein